MQPQSGQYDFIMSPGKPPKRGLLPGGGNSMGKRIAVVAFLLAIVIVLIIVVMTIVNSGGGSTAKLVTAAQHQNEIIRIAKLATTSGAQQSTQATSNFTQTCLLSVTTEQQQLVSYLASHGKKLGVKDLGLAKNASTDASLTAAVAASNFNTVYLSVMKTQLQSYQTALQDAFNSTTNATARQLLSDDYTSAQLLTKQLAAN
jgi:hypothetical protein